MSNHSRTPKKGKEGDKNIVDTGRRKLLAGGAAGIALFGYALREIAKIEAEGAVYDASKTLGKNLLIHKALAPEHINAEQNAAAVSNWNLINSIFGPFRHVVVSPASDHPSVRGIRHDPDWEAA